MFCISDEFFKWYCYCMSYCFCSFMPFRWQCVLFALSGKHELSIDQIFSLSRGCLLESVDFVVWTKSQKTKRASDIMVEEHFSGDISAHPVITHPNSVVALSPCGIDIAIPYCREEAQKGYCPRKKYTLFSQWNYVCVFCWPCGLDTSGEGCDFDCSLQQNSD